MIPELGQYCLILAFVIAGLQALLPQGEVRPRAATLLFVLSVSAFFCLMWSYITSDFTVLNVAENSHTLKPLIYKIAGVWGNHEGSMLLWLFILSVFGFAMARDKNLDAQTKQDALRAQGALAFGFLAFILFTSDPFARLYPPPLDGHGLNPLLQDIGLAMHPPLLYTGYVGFSAVFSLAFAALVRGKMDQDWARTAKPYVLAAWSALSAGIALGSWWAYYELGWGGWWFWDPVENASLMPWLLGTALVHSILVLEKRGGLVQWTCLLAILTFSLSMLGTFLVRSGVLTSVHAFASDPARGIFILCLLTVFTGGAFLAYALRAHKLNSGDIAFRAISRESCMIFNNLFMVSACATVLIGTLYPLLMQALGAGEISVGAPYFNATILPLMLPALILMGAAPYIAWKKSSLPALWPRLHTALLLTIGGAALMIFNTPFHGALPLAAAIAALWLLAATLSEWLRASDLGVRALTMPLTHHAMSIAHIGMAVAVLGMVGTSAYVTEVMQPMQPGQQLDIGRYTLRFKEVTSRFGENYAADEAVIDVLPFSGSQPITTLRPQRRYYPVADRTTTESAFHTDLYGDLYIALGANPMAGMKGAPQGWIVRAYTHPLVGFLWGGLALIALGGALSWIAALRQLRQKKTARGAPA